MPQMKIERLALSMNDGTSVMPDWAFIYKIVNLLKSHDYLHGIYFAIVKHWILR